MNGTIDIAPPAGTVDVIREARERGARAYLVKWRPLVVAVSATVTSLFELFDGDTPDPANIAVVWVSVLIACAFAGLVLAGVNAWRLAALVILLDLPMVVAWAHATGRPDPAFATYCGTVAIAAWILGPRAAVAIGTAALAIITAYWFRVGAWVPESWPDVFWVVFGTTVLAGAIANDVQRSFVRAAETMRSARGEEQKIARERQRLVAEVSHELRTPLASVNGFLDTVLRTDIELDDVQRRELLVHARRGGRQLELLVDDLLDIERAARGVLRLELRTRQAGSLLQEVFAGVSVPPERDVTLEMDSDVRELQLSVDERRLSQVLANLVGNALRHGHGAVHVVCRHAGAVIHIDVSDEGPGLPPELREHAFEPFVSQGRGEGSVGLGLAIARAMAELHGGSLDYVPDTGAGRHAFRIELPTAPA